MSYWGATVITNLISIIPVIGKDILIYLWGDYSISENTLNRFYSIHFLLPFILLVLILIHITELHKVSGTSNIGYTNIKINFNPYFTLKDIYSFLLSIILIILINGYYPFLLLEEDNYIQANSLLTPSHIIPELYLLPYYAILRTIESKELGVILMLGSILINLLLPFIQTSLNINQVFRPIYTYNISYFIIIFFLLGFIGIKEVIMPYTIIGLILTISYFYFYILFIIISFFEFLFFFL